MLKPVLGKKRFQPVFELMHLIALYGMNYGNGGDLKESGEINVLKVIAKKFSRNRKFVVFDVGSNIGKYSNAVVEYFGKEHVQIYAFEPSAFTFNELKKNTDLVKGSIVYNNFGLGKVPDTLQLYTTGDGSGLASVYNRKLDHHQLSMSGVEEIKLDTFDAYCLKNDIYHIDLLKLDVEGHELQCLQGATQMLEKNAVQCIQLEFGGCNIDSRTYFMDFWYLLSEKYRIYRIVKDGLREIKRYTETEEIFKTINILAIHKEY